MGFQCGRWHRRIHLVSEILFGKYRLGDQIARGGMAEIYHAHVVGAGGFAREIVVKRILPDLVEDEEFLEMFHDEANLAAALDHPNIVQIFDFDHVGDSFFIAMEYVRGADLSKLIRAAALQKKRLPPEVVVFVLSEVLAGLGYAHNLTDESGMPLNLVHRDISPANVLLSYTGAVKLADFGIAKAATSMVHTSAGILKGKYPYMSPEQAEGKPVDRRTDLFAIGIVLYQALLGRRPFRGKDSAELLDNVINGHYAPPLSILPTLDKSLASIIERALRIDPDQRFQRAEEFLHALRNTLDPPPTREDLERCLKKYIPEKPRTISTVAPRVGTEPTVRETNGSIGTADNIGGLRQSDTVVTPVDESTPPTQASMRPKPASKKNRTPVIGIAIGVVVALLLAVGGLAYSGAFTEATVEPVVDAAATSPELRPFTVLMRRNTEQENALRSHGLGEALTKRGFELRLMRFEQYDELFEKLRSVQVDLASVPLAVASTVAEADLVVPVERISGERLQAVKSRFTPAAQMVATVETKVSSDLTYIPDYLEVHVLAYRASKVELARQRWTEQRDAIEKALEAVNGRGLPEGYTLEEDPTEWDDFDIFVLGWTWTKLDENTQPAPRIAIRSASYWPAVEGMIERLNRHGQSSTTWTRGGPMTDLMVWLALHREHGLQRDKVFSQTPRLRTSGTSVTKMFAKGDIYLTRVNQLRASEIRQYLKQFQPGFTTDDIAFAPLPRGVSVDLDESGTPQRTLNQDGLVNAWLWAIPRSSENQETALDVALDIVSAQNQEFFANFNCWIPTNTGVNTSATGPIDPFCRRAIHPGVKRLTRPLRVAYPPDGDQLNATVTQFERLWTDLFADRGYRDPETSAFSRERLESIIEQNVR